MRILFLTSSEEDYLADGLLLGFREIFGSEVVDYPRRDILYRDCPEPMSRKVRGHGFTLYTGLLNEVPVDRHGVGAAVMAGSYELIVISDIWRQFGFFTQWRPYLNPANTVLIDGADTAQVFPHAGQWWRRPYYWLLPRPTAGFIYFKRELTRDSRFNLWHRLLPAFCLGALPYYRGMRQISFGFPSEKIVRSPPHKTKDFPRHIVDADVARRVSGGSTAYAFTSEGEYYADLQASRFGITTRRAGWDCLRHYEIAANGAVPCFRDLHLKPAECAPHGLVPGKNCLGYRDVDDLMRQVKELPAAGYVQLQQGALEWIRSKTARKIAEEVMADWKLSRSGNLAAKSGIRRAMKPTNESGCPIG